MNAHFISFGCKVNQYETESIKEIFISENYDISDTPADADVIIINSCTVTSSGDSKTIHTLKRIRKLNPDAVIVLTGCLPQASPEIADKLPEADIVTGTKNRNKISELVKRHIEKREQIVQIANYGKCDDFENIKCSEFKNKTRAFVKIQDGCNQFCSYCIIPYARGRCRSKPLDILKKEVKELAENGHKEIVLVGINLAFYGKEFDLCLADAVEVCCKIKGVERVRLGSLEPEVITDSDLERLSKLPQFCPHFHLSLQSGCDKTLKNMNRHYNCEQYYDLVCRIRKYFSNASFTTDIMVGFPDETDKDFEESLKFAEKIGFSKIHVFPYSVRPGTKAAEMKNQVSENIKAQRAKIMKSAGSQLTERFMKTQVGMTVPVLFERESSPEFHQGFTPNYTLIKIPAKKSEKSLRRMIFYVKIVESKKDCCIGELVKLNLPTV